MTQLNFLALKFLTSSKTRQPHRINSKDWKKLIIFMEANLNFLQLDLKHTNLSSLREKNEITNRQYAIAMAITWWCVVCKFQTGYSKEAIQVKDFVF